MNKEEESTRLHGTAVAIEGYAVLLQGPSGSGKSDLALRLIDRGAELIADDQTLFYCSEDQVFAHCPPSILGKLEVRGVGIIELPPHDPAPLKMIVHLMPRSSLERFPSPRTQTLLGMAFPLLYLDPWPASSVIQIMLALQNQGVISYGYQR